MEHGTRFELANNGFADRPFRPLRHPCHIYGAEGRVVSRLCSLSSRSYRSVPLCRIWLSSAYLVPKAGIEPARTELIPFSVLPGILETTAPPWLASAYFAPVMGFAPTE